MWLLPMLVSIACADPPSRWLDAFDGYPNATDLCFQSVSGPGMHVLWHAYTSSDPPEQVVGWYRERFPTAAPSTDALLEIRADKDRILDIYPVGGRYPTCEKAPGPDVRTVILVSQATRSP